MPAPSSTPNINTMPTMRKNRPAPDGPDGGGFLRDRPRVPERAALRATGGLGEHAVHEAARIFG